MAKLPTTDPINNILNETLEPLEHRDHIGLSELGHQCHRYLQLKHYWSYDSFITSRIRRLFDFGTRAEAVMISALEAQGYTVDGAQDEIVGYSGHWKGHIDGIAVKDERNLVEFKTHNDKSFKDLLKRGVELSKPQHYAQMQSYMGYKGLKCAIYMAENKNDSTFYFERVEFNPEYFEDLKTKEIEIVTADSLLPRIGNNSSTWFECKWCDASDVCFGKKEPSRNCRTCKHVDVLDDGEWGCGKHGDTLTSAAQKAGCEDYELAIMFKEIS